jgi:fibronectin-binding autotransporter adhesin
LATGGNWSISAWATTGGGTPALANFPLPQYTAIFQSTGLNSGATVTINSSYNIGTIDMSARTSNTMTLASSTLSPNIFGNWINGTGTTTSGAGTLTLLGRNKTQTITSAGKTFTQSITTNAIGGTVTLADNFSTSTSITLTNGTLNLAGFTAATPTFVTAAGTKNITFNGGTLAISGVTTTAFNNAIPTGFTTTAGTGTGVINMTGTSAKTFVGGGTTYNCTLNQGGLGALTVSGDNTFYNITNTVQPSTITFAASSTNIVANFGLKGTSGNLITLNSSISGTKFNLIKSGTNVISADYLSIRDSSVTPVSHMWYAGANSTNVSNNTGWLFKPFRSGNNMLMW